MSAEHRQEIQVKEALCLIELGPARHPQARELLAATLAEPGDRWPAVAGFELWRLLFEQAARDHDYEEADGVFEILSANYPAEELQRLIPFSVRKKIINSRLSVAEGPAFIPTRYDVERLTRLISVLDRVSGDPRVLQLPRWELFRALHGTNQPDRAIAVGLQTLSLYGLSSFFSEVHEIPWLLCQTDRHEEAMSFVQKWRDQTPEHKQRSGKQRALLIDAARVAAAMGKWQDADNFLNAYWNERRERNRGEENYSYHSRACLLQGLVRVELNDPDGAAEWWSRGLQSDAPFGSGFDILHWSMLSSLSGAASDEEARRALGEVLDRALPGSLLGYVKQIVLNHPAAIKTMWDSPQGRKWIRDYILCDSSYRDIMRSAAALAGAAIAESSAFGATASMEDAELILETSFLGVDAWINEEIGLTLISQYFACWNGITQLWPVQKKLFPEKMRARAGYLLGRRLMKRGNHDQAGKVLEGVLGDTSESQIEALATRALKELAAQP